MRERELSERRQRLGLPAPKQSVSITGPREGLPPAPDDGDDGNGGWISAYEEILRAVMRDLRVLNAAKKLHGGGKAHCHSEIYCALSRSHHHCPPLPKVALPHPPSVYIFSPTL